MVRLFCFEPLSPSATNNLWVTLDLLKVLFERWSLSEASDGAYSHIALPVQGPPRRVGAMAIGSRNIFLKGGDIRKDQPGRLGGTLPLWSYSAGFLTCPARICFKRGITMRSKRTLALALVSTAVQLLVGSNALSLSPNRSCNGRGCQ